MSDEKVNAKEVKLECLRLSGGDVRKAAEAYAWVACDQGLMMAAQAYQVIGLLVPTTELPAYSVSDAEAIRALDYFAAGQYDPEFLPWPRTVATTNGDAAKPLTPLSTDRGTALLDDQPEPVATEVRKQDDQDAAEIPAGWNAWRHGQGVFGMWSGNPIRLLFSDGYVCDTKYGDGHNHPTPHKAAILAWQDPACDDVRAKDAEREQQSVTVSQASDDATAPSAAPPPAQEAPAIPEGFIPWGGGEYLPVARGTPLVVLYRNGSEVDCTAGDEMSEFWHRSSTLVDHSPDHDIIAYRVIETGETQSELDSSQIEGGDRVEPLHDRPKLTNEEFESLEKIDGVLDAEPSPILRSEVPPAAETYLAPSGDEFATVNGQTHLIVSDEAEAQGQAETAPQAAYAPIHNEDEPSDAAVFAHGLNVEIDAAKAQDQKFNPFWLFGGAKKTLVGEGV